MNCHKCGGYHPLYRALDLLTGMPCRCEEFKKEEKKREKKEKKN